MPVISQLSYGRAARVAALFAIKRVLEPFAVVSFGQRGEDLLIGSLLSRVPHAPATYVDVGANHPVRNSNTFRLYLRGWRGILVDANPELVRLSARVRPHDRAVCAAVSDSAAERGFVVPTDHRLGRLEPAAKSTGRIVTPRTLTSILDDAGWESPFGVLSVDCEGSDLEVLCSLDLQRYRPALIVVEQETLDLRDLRAAAVVEHLAGLGYGIIAYDGSNGYYVSDANRFVESADSACGQ